MGHERFCAAAALWRYYRRKAHDCLRRCGDSQVCGWASAVSGPLCVERCILNGWYQQPFVALGKAVLHALGHRQPERCLSELREFGSNPGNLGGRFYVPQRGHRMPLVVVLHGCKQTAQAYDRGAAWSQMGDELGFAVLLPEQRRINNGNLCFNWFRPDDSRRDAGEALSIRQMIVAMLAHHALDSARIYITGLSAGGAMACAMLASYPDVFAGGAIIAGLPFGCANTLQQAMMRMRGYGGPDDRTLSAMVHEASGHPGPWPIVSVWQGSADATVNPSNADAIMAQWAPLHSVDLTSGTVEAVDGYPCWRWRDSDGRVVMEAYAITGMGHGTPLATQGTHGCGEAGPFMLEVAISSTRHICRFWGLAGAGTEAAMAKREGHGPHPPFLVGLFHHLSRFVEGTLRATGLVR
ncbi:PHB depolymerase family esterase [Novosphingobium sp. 1529]|uniref:extracellular catalytic domain type 1 short-chain-length polyhydroxyalkanoate depolymerase n=1 Tax=Novosphingobium sp. 1529 TaxID=3156424 RepID=UPI003390B838